MKSHMVSYCSVIKAYILQCGFLSEEIPIERGCRQGDPLAPYLFLMGAEILSNLIKVDPKIVGLNIKDNSIKITRFADDTTLILDGTQQMEIQISDTLWQDHTDKNNVSFKINTFVSECSCPTYCPTRNQ